MYINITALFNKGNRKGLALHPIPQQYHLIRPELSAMRLEDAGVLASKFF